MSRTYRRRKDKAPSWVTLDYIWDQGFIIRVPFKGKAARKEVSKWHSDSGWHGDYGSTPGWWIHEMHEVPFRARGRNALKKITLDNCEEADITSIFKKPHIYYW